MTKLETRPSTKATAKGSKKCASFTVLKPDSHDGTDRRFSPQKTVTWQSGKEPCY